MQDSHIDSPNRPRAEHRADPSPVQLSIVPYPGLVRPKLYRVWLWAFPKVIRDVSSLLFAGEMCAGTVVAADPREPEPPASSAAVVSKAGSTASAPRRGKKRAVVALLHALLLISYHVLRRRLVCRELRANCFTRRNRIVRIRYHRRRLRELGVVVVRQPSGRS